MAETGIQPVNRVRFAFWGGEEAGQLGSQHYVNELSERDIGQTALNLNLDMVASPNGVRFVHDGDGSSYGEAGPDGSADIERLFLDYFSENSLAAEATPFDGGSDYAPFLEAGIPAGGFSPATSERKPQSRCVHTAGWPVKITIPATTGAATP